MFGADEVRGFRSFNILNILVQGFKNYYNFEWEIIVTNNITCNNKSQYSDKIVFEIHFD